MSKEFPLDVLVLSSKLECECSSMLVKFQTSSIAVSIAGEFGLSPVNYRCR